MRKYLQSMFPSIATTISFLILPIILSIYYVVSQYSDKFVTEQTVSYADVQSNILGRALVEQGWITWFNRFMDFAIWGIVAAVILIAVWLVSSAKVAAKNHYAIEGFKNFRGSQKSWHSHFFVAAALKVLLIGIILYSIAAFVSKSVPQLQTTIALVLQQFSWHGVGSVTLAALGMVLLQAMIVSSIKIFKHLSLD